MTSYETLPYDFCPLNLDYLISKNQEAYATMNMLIVVSFIVNIILYSLFSHTSKTYMRINRKYAETVLQLNDDYDIFDADKVDVLNPFALYTYYMTIVRDPDTESESESESESASESDSDTPENIIITVRGDNTRRVLRSDVRRQRRTSTPPPAEPEEYDFDRDYRTPLKKNKTNLGIRGKHWKLE